MTYLNQHVPDWREAIDPIEAVRPSPADADGE